MYKSILDVLILDINGGFLSQQTDKNEPCALVLMYI